MLKLLFYTSRRIIITCCTAVFLLSGVYLLSGCDSKEDNPAPTSPESNGQTSELNVGPGQGTIEMEENKLEFEVVSCNFTGSFDTKGKPTMLARGRTPDEREFSLVVNRIATNTISGKQDELVHTMQLSISADDGSLTEYRATKVRENGKWNLDEDKKRRPLVSITGNNLRAIGVFKEVDSDETLGKAEVRAECKPKS